MLPFTVFDADGACAGMTTYMHIDAEHRRVEIGQGPSQKVLFGHPSLPLF